MARSRLLCLLLLTKQEGLVITSLISQGGVLEDDHQTYYAFGRDGVQIGAIHRYHPNNGKPNVYLEYKEGVATGKRKRSRVRRFQKGKMQQISLRFLI